MILRSVGIVKTWPQWKHRRLISCLNNINLLDTERCLLASTMHEWQRNRPISVNGWHDHWEKWYYLMSAHTQANATKLTGLCTTLQIKTDMLDNMAEIINEKNLNFLALLNKVGVEAQVFIACTAFLLVSPVLKPTLYWHLCFITKSLWLCISAN